MVTCPECETVLMTDAIHTCPECGAPLKDEETE